MPHRNLAELRAHQVLHEPRELGDVQLLVLRRVVLREQLRRLRLGGGARLLEGGLQPVERRLELAHVDEVVVVVVEELERRADLLGAHLLLQRLALLPRDDVGDEPRKLGEVEARVAVDVVPRHHALRLREVDVDAHHVQRALELLDVDRARAVDVDVLEGALQLLGEEEVHRRVGVLLGDHVLHQPHKLGELEPHAARRVVPRHPVAHRLVVDVLHAHLVERRPQLAQVDRPRVVDVVRREGGAHAVHRQRGRRLVGERRLRAHLEPQHRVLAHQLGQPVEELRVRLAQRRAADVVPRDQRAHVLGVDLEPELLEGGSKLLHVDRCELRRVVVRKHLAHALGARLWQQLALLVRDQVAHEVGVLGEVQRRRVVLVVPLQDGGGAGVLHAHRVERARELGGVDRPRLVGVEAVEGLLVRLGREGGERPLRLLRRHQVARQLRKLLRVDPALRAVAERLAVLGDRRAHVVGVARHAHRVERARELAPLDEPRAVGVEPVEGDGAPLDRRERGGRLLLLKRDDVAHERRKLADIEAARLLPRPALVLGHHVARAREVDVDAQ